MHHAIEPLSNTWWSGFAASLLIVSTPLIITRNMNPARRQSVGKVVGLILLGTFASLQIYQILRNTWSLDTSLPLQLCALSSILSGVVFFTDHPFFRESLIFWGIPGALHSILTPELVYGYDLYYIAEYYLAHAGIIAAALYLPLRLNFSIRTGSWWRIWLYTQPVLAAVGLINWLNDSNYMYLCKKPMADNPFVIGEWPWYIIGLQAAGLLHFGLVYLLYGKMNRIRPANP